MTLGEKSSAAVAIASWQKRLYLAWTGTDTHLNVVSSPDGHHFSAKTRLKDKSYKTEMRTSTSGSGMSQTQTVCLEPALAGLTSGFTLAWTGADSHLNLLTTPDRHLNLLTSRDGSFGQPLWLNEKSAAGPDVCGVDGEVVLAWTGSDRHLNVVISRNRSFDQPVRLDETSFNRPAVCTHLGRLFLAWTGSDYRLNVALLGHAR